MLGLACTAAVLALQAQSPKLTEYLNLAEATLRQPVTAEELRAVVLSTDGARAIKRLFEISLDASLVVGGDVVSPEVGGEAMLHEGQVEWVLYPDPVHPTVRELVELSSAPASMLAVLESTETGRFLLDNTGGLHALLYQIAHEPPTEARLAVLEDVLRNTVATHFKTWTTDPDIQAEMIDKTQWRGRYVGFWHIHPPRAIGSSFGPGIEPSVADMRNAIELGQFVTIVFQPLGFDVYDLSPLRVLGRTDLSQLQAIQYRDPAWKAHFEALLRSAQGSSTP